MIGGKSNDELFARINERLDRINAEHNVAAIRQNVHEGAHRMSDADELCMMLREVAPRHILLGGPYEYHGDKLLVPECDLEKASERIAKLEAENKEVIRQNDRLQELCRDAIALLKTA
jgi:hypothetical protein